MKLDLPHDLDRLEAGQLVRALVEVEPTYTFKHNLVQQVACESLVPAIGASCIATSGRRSNNSTSRGGRSWPRS